MSIVSPPNSSPETMHQNIHIGMERRQRREKRKNNTHWSPWRSQSVEKRIHLSLWILLWLPRIADADINTLNTLALALTPSALRSLSAWKRDLRWFLWSGVLMWIRHHVLSTSNKTMPHHHFKTAKRGTKDSERETVSKSIHPNVPKVKNICNWFQISDYSPHFTYRPASDTLFRPEPEFWPFVSKIPKIIIWYLAPNWSA